MILNFSPQLFGIKLNGSSLVPVFNLDVLNSYMPFTNISFACIILKEILRIIYGRYAAPLAIGTVVLGSITLIITIFVLSNHALWNTGFTALLLQNEHVKIPTEFTTLLLQNEHVKIPAGFDLSNPMASVANIFIGLLTW